MRLVSAIGGGQTIQQAAGLLMLFPVAGFLAVTWGYVAQQGWWSPLALTSAALFALVFDAAVIAHVLWRGRAGVVPGL